MFCYTDTNANAVPIYGVGVGFVVAKLHASMNQHYPFKIGIEHPHFSRSTDEGDRGSNKKMWVEIREKEDKIKLVSGGAGFFWRGGRNILSGERGVILRGS